MPICITGMHRSGTSMVARMLNLCGVYLGEEHELRPPQPDNPEGYWEHVALCKIDDDLLASHGGAWDVPPTNVPIRSWTARLAEDARAVLDDLAQYPQWGWKDPRSALCLPFWKALEPDLRTVVCIRHPLDVAKSLTSRSGSSLLFGLRLWHRYYQAILDSTTSEERVVVHYDRLLASPEAELRRALEYLNIAYSADLPQNAAGYSRRELRHSNLAATNPSLPMLTPNLQFLYTTLCVEAGFESSVLESAESGEYVETSRQSAEALDEAIAEQAVLAREQRQRFEQAEAERQHLAREFETKVKHIELLRGEIADLAAQRDRGLAQLKVYEGELTIRAVAISVLEDSALHRGHEDDTLRMHLAAAQLENQSLRASTNEIREDLAAMSDNQNHLRGAVLALQNELVSQSEDFNKLNDTLCALRRDLQAKAEFIAALKQQTIRLNNRTADETIELRSKIAAQQRALDSLSQSKFMRLARAYWRFRLRTGNRRLENIPAFVAQLSDDELTQIALGQNHGGEDRRTHSRAEANAGPLYRPPTLSETQARTFAWLMEKLRLSELESQVRSDASAGLTPLQFANLRLLLDFLTERGMSGVSGGESVVDAANLPEAQHGERKSLLFITGQFPNPIHGGGGRCADFIKSLSVDHDIDLLTWYVPEQDELAHQALRPFCRDIFTVSPTEMDAGDPSRLLSFAANRVYDVVHYTWPRTLRLYRRKLGRAHVFTHVESISLRDLIDLERAKPLSAKWWETFASLIASLQTEIVEAAQLDGHIAVTRSDADFLAQFDGQAKHFIVPTPVHFAEFGRPEIEPTPRAIAFVGNYLHYPNVDAVRWFAHGVVPTLKTRMPDIKVWFVGASPPSDIVGFSDSRNVFVTGTVEDVRPFIQQALVCVAPLVNGAGIRGKVNQYAALRRVCVATSIAARDLPYEHERDIVIADSASDFANAVTSLLEQPQRARQMGQLAYLRARRSFDLDFCAEGLRRVHNHLLGTR